MAHTVDTAPAPSILTRVWNAIIWMGEHSARAHTVQKLNSMTDDQFASMGVTRAQMVQRALSAGEM